ncbi:hypothetical protein RI054_23g100890 [Pseudoscourfieldia marina]
MTTTLTSLGRMCASLTRPRVWSSAVSSTSLGDVLTPVSASADECPPPLANYSQAMQVNTNARLVFVSGQLGSRPDGSVAEDDPEEQARQCFRNVDAILKGANMGLKDVVRLSAFVTKREYLPSYMKARDDALREACAPGTTPPASTLMIVSGFSKPEFLVEVEAVAAAR